LHRKQTNSRHSPLKSKAPDTSSWA